MNNADFNQDNNISGNQSVNNQNMENSINTNQTNNSQYNTQNPYVTNIQRQNPYINSNNMNVPNTYNNTVSQNNYNQNQVNNNLNTQNYNGQTPNSEQLVNNVVNEYVSLDNRLQKANDNQLKSEEDDIEVLGYDYKKARPLNIIFSYIIDFILTFLAIFVFYISLSTIYIFVDNGLISGLINFIVIMMLLFGFIIYRSLNETSGKSIGRRTTNTKVLDEKNNNITLITSLLRTLLSYIINSTIIGGIVNIIIIFMNNESIEDKIFKTTTVDLNS